MTSALPDGNMSANPKHFLGIALVSAFPTLVPLHLNSFWRCGSVNRLEQRYLTALVEKNPDSDTSFETYHKAC